VHGSMTNRSKYKHASRFKFQHLDIMDYLLYKDWMMETILRKRWTLALVLRVGRIDGDPTKNTKFWHEELHSHDLDTTLGLATQSVQDIGDINVWRHGIIGSSMDIEVSSWEFKT
jgi:hypothetical protein